MHLTTPPFRIDIPHQKLLKQIAKHLNNKGLGYGSGHLSHSKNQFYVNIPKNASSYISVWLINNKWQSKTYKNSDNVSEAIIVLRDPVNRWISGISQYLSSYVVNDDKITPQIFNEFYNLAIERIIFDVIWQFDDHTWPQFYFFDECLSQIKMKTYFLLDNNFNNNFKKYLNLEDPINCPRNATTNNTFIIANKIKDELSKNDDLVSKIKEAYEQDYDLINSVKFIDYSK